MISYNRGKLRQNYMYVYSYSLRFWGSMDSISDLYQETIFKSPLCMCTNSLNVQILFSQKILIFVHKKKYITLYRSIDNMITS